MKTTIIAAALLSLSAIAAQADTSNLADKVMSDLPGTKGGITVSPTEQFHSGSIADHVQMDLSAVRSGRTINPVAQPDRNSLSANAFRS